ncbi:DUF397 domain-containing protein [Streptomyces sp. NPDC018352]|uniref:DUF397 domain-containing protein n=1 Tax=Streptomyces sp. NPDC018352 TaxID=3157194 RepID=UPI0033FA55EA
MSERDWQRSSFCGGGGNNCVEVAVLATGEGIALRESESPDTVLVTGRDALCALLIGVKAGQALRPRT